MANQVDPSVSEKYTVEDKGDKWHLFCKICKTGFSLKKPGDHPGNLLKLLDHYAECEKKMAQNWDDTYNRPIPHHKVDELWQKLREPPEGE